MYSTSSFCCMSYLTASAQSGAKAKYFPSDSIPAADASTHEGGPRGRRFGIPWQAVRGAGGRQRRAGRCASPARRTGGLDGTAAFPYFFWWRCFAAGAVPGLQNQWMAERSSVGSTPMHLRQLDSVHVPRRLRQAAGDCCFRVSRHSAFGPFPSWTSRRKTAI